MTPRIALAAALLAAASPSFTACGELTKISECNKVIETVNASDIGQTKGTDAKAWKKESKRAKELEQNLADLKITDAKLKKYVGDYRDLLDDYADLATKAGKLEDDDVDGALDLAEKAVKVAQDGDELTDDINTYCTGSK